MVAGEVNGTKTTHIWDGANIVRDKTGSSATNEKFIRGVGGTLVARVKSGGTDRYLHNAHGDVVQTVNSGGTASGLNKFDAFGNNVSNEKFGYAGEYRDAETGLIYLRNRYYNPGTGRFISEDPIRDGGNPIMFIDPTGLISVIFVASGMEDQADARKEYYTEKYGTDSYRIIINSAEHFVEKWNEWFNLMAEQGQTVDTIEIISHGGITGEVGKDEGGTAYSTAYASFGGMLLARDIDAMGSSDRSVTSLVSTTVKELNINSCNSATKETYNLVFGFMGVVDANSYSGFDGGARWDANAENSGSTVRGDHVRGGGDWTLIQSTPWDPWRLVRENQGTWWIYVDKKSDGTPARDRIGRRTW